MLQIILCPNDVDHATDQDAMSRSNGRPYIIAHAYALHGTLTSVDLNINLSNVNQYLRYLVKIHHQKFKTKCPIAQHTCHLSS